MQISPKTLERAIEVLSGSLRIYREKIDGAFLKAEGALTVSLGLRFKPVDGKMEIKTAIRFVTDQVNDSFETMFDENQAELFPKEEKAALTAPPDYSIPMCWWPAMPDCRLDVYNQ